jgi:hypothetical protein
MHGYFITLKLYDAARIIANPFVYAEHREKTIRQKMEKLADSRIRTRKDNLPKINRALAERIMNAHEKEDKRKRKRDPLEETIPGGEVRSKLSKKDRAMEALSDPRFKAVFENPDFEVDENSREFALLHPSQADAAAKRVRTKTAVDEEEEEEGAGGGMSSDDLGMHSESSEEDEKAESNSSEEGESCLCGDDCGYLLDLQTWNWSICGRGGRRQSTTRSNHGNHCPRWFLHERIPAVVHQRSSDAILPPALVNDGNHSTPNLDALSRTATLKEPTLSSMGKMEACPSLSYQVHHGHEIDEKTVMIGGMDVRSRRRVSSTWEPDWSEEWRGRSFRSRTGKEGLREDKAFVAVAKMSSEDCSPEGMVDPFVLSTVLTYLHMVLSQGIFTRSVALCNNGVQRMSAHTRRQNIRRPSCSSHDPTEEAPSSTCRFLRLYRSVNEQS